MALIGSLCSTPALADTLHPFVSVSVTHDDNLLRLSDDELKLTNGGGDTYRSAIGGLIFEVPVGRQIFSGTADLSSVKFDRFNQLDYIGRDVIGEWHWFLAAHFEGHVGGSYSRALASFADFNSDERNIRVTKKQYIDGTWRFHPSWQWRNGYTKYEYNYDLVSQRVNDRTDEYVTTGIDYLAASGSTAGLQFRRVEGRYPYGQALGSSSFGNGYVQDEAKANILWLVSGSTQLMFLGGWVQRKQSAYGGRVDSGTNARLIANWWPTQRVKLTGQGWREFAAIEGALIDSALATGSSVDATWDVSAKIQALASVRHESRRFTPNSAASASLASASLTDATTNASIGLAYKPLRTLTLKLNVYRDQRSGNVTAGTTSFKANGVSFNAIEQF